MIVPVTFYRLRCDVGCGAVFPPLAGDDSAAYRNGNPLVDDAVEAGWRGERSGPHVCPGHTIHDADDLVSTIKLRGGVVLPPVPFVVDTSYDLTGPDLEIVHDHETRLAMIARLEDLAS